MNIDYCSFPNDIPIVILSTLFFFISRNILIQFIYLPIQKHFEIKKKSFFENIWYTTYYTFIGVLSFMILSSKDWFWNTNTIYLGVPDLEVIDSLRFLFLFQFGFYIHLLISIFVMDQKLEDFTQMLIHHFVSILLISLSYFCFFHKIGIIVLFIHDIVDIFLYSAKW
jgi:sphingoid base N-palmitoyltransferase